MSYADTNCPCGGKKPNDTMLCDACMEHLKDHPSMTIFQDRNQSLGMRRHAAFTLLALAEKRSAK